MGKLTVKTVAGRKGPGMYGDGDGLYLLVSKAGRKSWICRVTVHGKRKEIGLGSIEFVTLAEARNKAHAIRKQARAGLDPLAEKRKSDRVPTFIEAARLVHAENLPTWKNAKHAATWLSSVEKYAGPAFGSKPVNKISTAEIVSVLSPIWTEKHETAQRLMQRLSTIFDWARSKDYITGENPVRGSAKCLPKVKRSAIHHASLPWRDLPAFMADLRTRPSVSARCLEFIILTAARSGEARGALWSEIDFDARLWRVPAERMKRDKEHLAPLSDAAPSVLDEVRGADPLLCFPSPMRGNSVAGRVMSDAVFTALLRRMGRRGFVVHGFRSTFRDSCSDSAKAPREIAEAALSHATGNAIEQAYARSDLLERRRPLMDAWGRYATGQAGGVV